MYSSHFMLHFIMKDFKANVGLISHEQGRSQGCILLTPLFTYLVRLP